MSKKSGQRAKKGASKYFSIHFPQGARNRLKKTDPQASKHNHQNQGEFLIFVTL